MGIEVSINATFDIDTSNITASGSFTNIISDLETFSFGVSEPSLKRAVGVYFGKEPQDAYLKSPTPPNGDLYEMYDWAPVNTIVVPSKAEVLSVDTEKILVKSQQYTNTTTEKKLFNVTQTEMVLNSSTTLWNSGGNLSVPNSIDYNIIFNVNTVCENYFLNYTQPWFVSNTYTKTQTIGESADVSIELLPGQTVNVNFYTIRANTQMRITYNAFLNGSTAVTYSPPYKNCRDWSLPIDSVMESAGIPNSILSSEDIALEYYGNSSIEIIDLDTEQMVSTLRTF